MDERPHRHRTASRTNELGPIAASYDDLQSLPALFAVTRNHDFAPPGSSDQAVRALLQASEVSLITITCSIEQAHRAIVDDDQASLIRAMHWMIAFGRAWADIAWRVSDAEPPAVTATGAATGPAISILESSNWHRHEGAGRVFSDTYLNYRKNSPSAAVTDRMLLQYTLLERSAVERTAVSRAGVSYVQLVDPDALDTVVRRSPLPGDTVFIPFRSAHQISEILVDAANDHLELAIYALDNDRPVDAIEILYRVDRLLDAIVTVAEVLAEHLEADDYHRIRENLGLTSGSHSVGLHYHLMRDLYPLLAGRVGIGPPSLLRSYVRSIGLHIDRWRAAHLALPRQNLGGNRAGTRSLTGAQDALHTVQRMRERGWAADPLASRLSPLSTDGGPTGALPLADVEATLLADVAHRTQQRFPEVQARRGIFSQPPAFETPPVRQPRSGNSSDSQ